MVDKVATFKSLPSRERGLKYEAIEKLEQMIRVAPFTGAWIEILYLLG